MPSSSFLHQLGMCQKYRLILPPSLFKSFYPLREDLKGIPYITELISSRLPTARFWWEQEPTLSWELAPSQAPTALPGEPLGTAGGQAGAIPYSQRQGSWSLCPNPEDCRKPLLFPSHFSFFLLAGWVTGLETFFLNISHSISLSLHFYWVGDFISVVSLLPFVGFPPW